MWGAFHRERCSEEYNRLWIEFLMESIDCRDPHPIFYQHVTDLLFEEMIKEEYQVADTSTDTIRKEALTYEERNVLRYVGGYVLRALRKKLERSGQPRKKELLLCLTELNESKEEDHYDESSDWLCIKDRGGLNHITHNLFMLMCAMELEVKHHINSTKAQPDSFMKEELKRKLTANDDVGQYWDVLSINWTEEDGKLLLSMIIDHWITVRGFAYTSMWMEKYKNSARKKVQKSKGIRKTVMGTSTSTSEDNMQ